MSVSAAFATAGIGPDDAPDQNQKTTAGFDIERMAALSHIAQQKIRDCQPTSDSQLKDCVAGALAEYAASIGELKDELPRVSRNLPSLVARAARDVHRANTALKAAEALRLDIGAISYKKSPLLRTVDQDITAIDAAVRNQATDTLNIGVDKFIRPEF